MRTVSSVHTINAATLIGSITIRVRYPIMTRVRLWLSARIVALAACIGGYGVEIEVTSGPSVPLDDAVAQLSGRSWARGEADLLIGLIERGATVGTASE